MGSLSPEGRISPYPLPSLPPSPSEEDLGTPRLAQFDEEALETQEGSYSSGGNGKGKDRMKDVSLQPSYADGGLHDEVDSDREGYPPVNGGEAETRRIEENLRRWEVAERQRRKAQRESAASTAPTSSIAGVARRASLLWPNSRAPKAGVGAHHALQTSESEDAVPLEDIEGSPSPIPSPTPTPGPGENPFSDPGGSSSSLFVNAVTPEPHARTQLDEDFELETPRAEHFPGSVSEASPQTSQKHPPPEPLGLPPPRTPPPRAETPHANRPPEPVSPPDPKKRSGEAHRQIDAEDEKPVRWWTDWLCGCKEDGDVQAGRTNPLE